MKGVVGLETWMCKRHRSRIRDPPQLFCSATLLRWSTSATLVLHQWFLAFSAALFVLVHKTLYSCCSLGRFRLFALALHRYIHASLFFLERLINLFEIQSSTRTKGRSRSLHSASTRAPLKDCHDAFRKQCWSCFWY